MEKLLRLLTEMEEAIPLAAKKSELVSQSTVGWHIEHSLLVISAIIDTVKKSDPGSYKWKFSLPWLFVYSMGSMPRGRGKAPASVQPGGDCGIEKLQGLITTVKEKYKELDDLPRNAYFKHPYFGHLNLRPTRKFLAIHTEHHLKIIREIIHSN